MAQTSNERLPCLSNDARITTLICVIAISTAISGCNSESGSPRPSRVADSRSTVASDLALPPIRPALFSNAGEGAHYVNSDVCIECHQDEFNSYLHTAHSRTLDKIDVTQEPPDAEFSHGLSGRSYEVYREGNQFRHRELVQSPDGTDLVTADHPMRYVIGSGNHSRSYLLEIEGFLFESPITWYASRQDWDMSPGYLDDPKQRGFARPITHGCLRCHVGPIDSSGHDHHKDQDVVRSVSCESCHGPGSLHVKRHQSDASRPTEIDNTIVHPARLPRELQEAICGQCHLATTAEANIRGRTIADFRPGLHLSDFRVRFQQDSENDAMTVVGHIEQMRSSRCYKMSPEMTCTTCHSMHGRPDREQKVGRESCLVCHTPAACAMDPAERIHKSATDDCTTCHMPESDTDISHFVFRHHRIGIHQDSSPEPGNSGFRKLIPVDDITHLPELEQKRCLGLAYIKLSEGGEVKNPQVYAQFGVDLLEEVRGRGLQDAEVDAALAWAYMRNGEMVLASDRGRSALLYKEQTEDARHDAMAALSRVHAKQHEYQLAAGYLEDLIRFRHVADDYWLLAMCRREGGDLVGSLDAARQAVAIRPDHSEWHRVISELYLATGNQNQAEWHRQRSQRLRELSQSSVDAENDGDLTHVEHQPTAQEATPVPKED